MRKIALPERDDWRAEADRLGFRYHTLHGEPYWDESSAYQFTLSEIDDDLCDPATRLHGLCLEAVEHIVASEELMLRLGVPDAHLDYVAASWRAREPALYGRFDFAYSGDGPAKLLEYNADTPTTLYEAASFQWSWLEAMIEQGKLPPGTDQFNAIHEALVARFGAICKTGLNIHFASSEGSEEDFATVEYLAWTANEAGLVPHYTPVEKIGVTTLGYFADDQDAVIGTLFKLYPWEDLLRDDFASHLQSSGCRFIEPPWKALLSNKGLLPVLWELFEDDPNLLPSFFQDDLEAGGTRVDRAADRLARGHVIKPVFSREGQSVEIVEGGVVTEASQDRAYDAHAKIVQAYASLPDFDGTHPVLGAWIVGDECVGMGIREDRSRITQDLSLFKPHVILPETD